MKISVLNGSPKGMTSVTMQYVHYIQNKFPQHELKIFSISRKIKNLENDPNKLQEILDHIQTADGVLWATPVYYLLVPANYKRFIEIIFENGLEEIFRDKYAAVLTSSIHFFDHTAHNYLRGICDDLNMRFVDSFSADMADLLKEKERKRLSLFAGNFFDYIETNASTSKAFQPVVWNDFEYSPGEIEAKTDAGNKKVLILTDSEGRHGNLNSMTERFRASLTGDIETINLHDLDIKGSCLGCIQCGYDNRCAYQGKDEYCDFYVNKVKAADIIVLAGAIKDRYLSSKWKIFLDRSFFLGHTPSLIEKQVGFIISGPLSQIPNLSQMLEAYVELQHANLAGIVCDECSDSQNLERIIQDLASRIIRFSDNNYIKSPTFLGVGGSKLFRDEIWGRLRFPFRADYEAYKKLGIYDFPQKQYKTRFRNNIMLFLSRSSGFRKEVNKRIKEEMIKPLNKILHDLP